MTNKNGITPARYQREAMRTKSESSDIVTAALGLAGESGEFADHIKKWRDHGHELDRDFLIKELGDILFYVALACELADVTLASVMTKNINKLKLRYPDGFSTERSINRGPEE